MYVLIVMENALKVNMSFLGSLLSSYIILVCYRVTYAFHASLYKEKVLKFVFLQGTYF